MSVQICTCTLACTFMYVLLLCIEVCIVVFKSLQGAGTWLFKSVVI